MARIRKSKGQQRKNIFLANISGQIGKQFIVKQYRNTVVISNFPDMSGVKPSAKQKAKRSLFQDAVDYAKGVLKDPKKKASYTRKLKGKRSVYHAAISEYLMTNRK